MKNFFLETTGMFFLDGAMGTQLQLRGLEPGEIPELWNLRRPGDVRAVHEAYYAAGSNAVYANTFGANGEKYHGDAPLRDVVFAGVAIAREAASNVGGRRFVALDVAPTGRLLKPSGDFEFDAAYDAFAEEVRLGAEAGVDFIAIETMSDSYELKAAVLAAKENSDLPILATVALGDDGKLYSTYTDELVRGMARLCRRADVITPNVTEAHFLTGVDIPREIPDARAATELALELCARMRRELGVNKIVITGIHFGDRVGNAVMVDGEVRLTSMPRLERSFPGTGEVFTSTLLGEIVRGKSLYDAAEAAQAFTYKVIEHSQSSPEPTRNGVLLEECLSHLCDRQ